MSGVYASLIAVAAYGALRNAIWGKWFLLGVLITSLPFELWEIHESYSIIKFSVLILTVSGCLIVGLELFKQQPRKV
ncbi:MAG: putative rane protein [Cyanobacteriota bacterium]